MSRPMDLDLLIAIGFIAAISGLAFLAGRRLSMSVYHQRPLLLASSLVFSLVFAFGLSNRLSWAEAFPTAAALCWSNWMPVFLCFSAGLAARVAVLRRTWRYGVSISMLSLALGFLTLPVARPFLFPLDIDERARWEDGVCLQSHGASCGPAAAATLLHQTAQLTAARLTYGNGYWAAAPLPSAERLMAHACLTSSQGTSSLGLVRGLRLAVAGSGRKVEIADSDPRRWEALQQLPNVAVVRFRTQDRESPVRRLLGTDGEGHAVVVHSRTPDGRWRVGDPAIGWHYWRDDEFRKVFTGEAIYLACKSKQPRSIDRVDPTVVARQFEP